MRPWSLERLNVIAKPAFIPDFYHMRAMHMRQYVAPVIIVLDEIALGEAHAIPNTLPGDGNPRDGEIAGLPQFPLNAILSKDEFIQC